MVTQLSDHVLSIVRDLLATNWTPGNTASYDPSVASGNANFLLVHTESYDYHPADPQVAVATFEEGVAGGGTTNYTGIRPDGTGLNQERTGTVFVDCWAEDEPTGDYNGQHAQDIVDLLMKEVERIAHANATGGSTDLRYLSPGEPVTNDDAGAEPPVFGQQLALRYGYLKEPP